MRMNPIHRSVAKSAILRLGFDLLLRLRLRRVGIEFGFGLKVCDDHGYVVHCDGHRVGRAPVHVLQPGESGESADDVDMTATSR